MASSRVRFSTTHFVMAHGRKPSGYGSWAFAPSNLRSMRPTVAEFDASIRWFTGSYSWAKAQAALAFKAAGIEDVEVLS